MFQPKLYEVLLYSPKEQAWLYFHQPEQVITAWRPDEILPALERIENAVEGQGKYSAGFLTYEAALAFERAYRVKPDDEPLLPLLWFGIYPGIARLPSLEGPTNSVTEPAAWQAEVSETTYRQSIRRIKTAIAHGKTYQVNYTYRLRAAWQKDAWAHFAALATNLPAPYAAFIESEDWAISCFSPELFFSLDGSSLTSKPMKGTAQRGVLLEDDRRQANWLQRSQKNRAENVMIVDMVRNDLGKIAHSGSVQTPALFEVEKYPTVWQMTSTVQAETDASLDEIFRALFPAASITGAPKIRTMQIIEELEGSPRRIYTGSIGSYAPGRKARFNVAIRTMLIDKKRQQAEYGVGGGIVWDSRPGLEWEETRTKAQILFEQPEPFDLIETLRWGVQEGWYLLEQHLERLARSAVYFSYPFDLAAADEQLNSLAKTFSPKAQRARLALGPDGRITIEHQPLGSGSNPRQATLAHSAVNSGDRFLYHKTSRRGVYEKAREAAAGFDEVLLWNERGELTEACIANLIVEMEGRLFTPPVSCGLLPGTLRGWLLAQGEIQERVIRIEELPACSRIFLANSVRGMWEISVS